MALTKVQIDGVEFSDSTDLNVDSGTLVVDATNNRVGVGTTAPGEPLTVQCATDQGLLLQSYGTTTGAVNTGPYIYGNFNDGTTNRSAGSIAFLKENGTSGNYASYMAFQTRANGASPAEKVRIDSSGRVGLGTTSPVTALDVRGEVSVAYDASYGLRFYNQDRNNWSSIGNQIATGSSSANLVFKSGTGTMVYDNSGRLGIGTTSPSNMLHIEGSSPAIRLKVTSGPRHMISPFSGDLYIEADPDNSSSSTNLIFSVDGGEALRIDSSQRLLVGTASTLDVGSTSHLIQTETTGHNVSHTRHGGTLGIAGPVLSFARSRGTTPGSVTAVVNGDNLGYIMFHGANGTDFSNRAAWIACEVDGTPFSGGDTTDLPGRLVFATTPDGTGTPIERMRLNQSGSLNIFDDGNGLANRVLNGAGTTFSLFVGLHSATSVNDGTVSFRVWSNGDVVNTNDSYGAISDIKLKENIVDAESQWDDFKAVRFRKYNFKEETGHETFTQLGVIAQELELVSPGLVTETPDLDEDGNDLGTTTKSVKYSILTKKALVALQEAMERIETLETVNASQSATIAALDARLTALESA